MASLHPPVETKALLFDCDGTLVDTLSLYRECWRTVFGDRGFEMHDDWFESFAGLSMEPFIASAFPDIPPDTATEIENEGLALFLASVHELTVIDSVVDVVRANAGVRPMAVVSGGPGLAVEASLKGVGIRALFDLVITADDVSDGKPAPDVYLLAMERLGYKPDDCAVYEDTDAGIESAFRAGISVVFDVRTSEMARM